MTTFWVLNNNYSYSTSLVVPNDYIMYGNFETEKGFITKVHIHTNLNDEKAEVSLELDGVLKHKMSEAGDEMFRNGRQESESQITESGGLLLYLFYLYLTNCDYFGIKLFDQEIDPSLFTVSKLQKVLQHNKSYAAHCDEFERNIIGLVNSWIQNQTQPNPTTPAKLDLLNHINAAIDQKTEELYHRINTSISKSLDSDYIGGVTHTIKSFIESCLTEAMLKFDMVNPDKVIELEKRLEVLEALVINKYNIKI